MRILVSLSLLLLFISGCTKNHDVSFIGTWELRVGTDFGGMVRYPPGNGELLVFTSNRLKRISKGQTIQDVAYYVQKDSNRLFSPPRLMDQVIGLNTAFFVDVQRDTLSVYPTAVTSEEGGAAYVRITQ